jgi:GGDEF domain-containing protein
MAKNTQTSVTLNTPPDMPELHHVLSQALEKRGQRVEVSWRVPHKMMLFVLQVVCDIKGGVPQWCLYFEHARKREMIFDYPSYDVLLIFNHITSSSQAVIQQHGTSPKTAAQQVRDAGQQGKAPVQVAAQAALPPALEALRTSRMPPTSQSASAAAAAPATPPGVPSDGDLSRYTIPDLLHTIALAKMTGKLEVRHNQTTATVYVSNGAIVDATAMDLVGDDALIELLAWKEGQFVFEPRVLRNSHTVHQSIETLLEQSKHLTISLAQLKDRGMKPTSTFLPKNPNMPELQFVQKSVPGAPADGGILLKFYRLMDGKQTVDELLRTTQMSRFHLLMILHHLIVNDLVIISNQPAQVEVLTVAPRAINTNAIQSVMMSLRRVETGMFLYPAFLYFLEQEYFRSYRSGTPLSVLVFEMNELRRGLSGEWIKQALPTAAVLDAVLRISQLKRHVDLLAHYDAFDYAMLLPNTRANGAHTFATRIIRALTSEPLGGIDPAQLSIAFGSATIPDDFVDLSSLLGAADLAMVQARQKKIPLVMFRDIKHCVS